MYSATQEQKLGLLDKYKIRSYDDYRKIWQTSVEHPEQFWSDQASIHLDWFHNWETILESEQNNYRWFSGGKINASYNCLDRHIDKKGHKTAILWEGEDGRKRTLNYKQLLTEVCKFAAALQQRGLKAGDTVTIYMPMVPELMIAMLACSRLGIVHNVVFAGFSSEALGSRTYDSNSKLVITADASVRRNKLIPLKELVDQSLSTNPQVKTVVVFNYQNQDVQMKNERDLWWDDFVGQQGEFIPAAKLDSEHPLFLLYTSGSTGKPKGIMHSTAGYLLGAALSFKYIFDYKDDDIFWCTADAGWITGHTYGLYGPLLSGASLVMYDGAPDTPDWGRYWQMIERYKVTTFYTAPTAIRSFMKCGSELPKKYDLTSLKLIGSVGEPINPEAWHWYHEHIGGNRCPLVDTWWQTETGSIMISPFPKIMATKPGSAAKPFFGIKPEVVDIDGQILAPNNAGYLVIDKPWPSMMRSIHGDHKRYREQYFQKISGKYFTGDRAVVDEEGDFWILGRVDDVINISGHRLSTMDVESTLTNHPLVAEAAVVGVPDQIKGEALSCFIVLKQSETQEQPELALSNHICNKIGKLAKPSSMYFTQTLPKTRSGKVMRRILRTLASGEGLSGDLSTLENVKALEELQKLIATPKQKQLS